jgi:hypothetical protein
MKKIYIIIPIIIFTCIWGCEEIIRRKIGGLAGSYPFVESWKIDASETEVVNAINELNGKALQDKFDLNFVGERDTGYNWDLDVMVTYLKRKKIDSLTPLPEHNDQNSFTDYWLYINFYYPDTKEIVYTGTRPDVMDSSITTIALVGFSKINDSTDYRLINRDFWYLSNKIQINKFEKTIIQPIIDKIKERNIRNNEK